MLDTDVSDVTQKNYDLMGDLLEVDILILFRQVLREEESLVKVSWCIMAYCYGIG
jgi:hypothetical protein